MPLLQRLFLQIQQKVNNYEAQKKRRDIMTFSKKWVSRLMCASIVWISLSYVLAFMGMTDIAESLSSTVVTGVIFVMLPYFAKSLFETNGKGS